MARKKQLFQSIRDDQDETPRDIPPRPDRNAARAEARELEALATRLSRLEAGKVAALPLDPQLVSEIGTLRTAGLDSSRRRQRKRVASLLRDCDLEALHRELDGPGTDELRNRELERWRRRIVDEGDSAINDFVECHIDVDRGQLRTLARQAGGPGAAARKAEKKLFVVLKEAVETAPATDSSDL